MKSLMPMVRRRDWDGMQSFWVLPAARRLYLVGALVAVGLALLAIFIALVFQLLSLIGAKTEPVPAPASVSVNPIDLNSLDQLFQGPSNLRATSLQLERPVRAGMPVARLAADSRIGLANFPVGFQIIGGRDAELLREEREGYGTGTLLVATERYAQILNAMPAGQATLPQLQVRVLATDRNGSASQPTNLSIAPSFSAPAPEEAAPVEDIGGPEALRRIATILAGIAAPKGTPEWFDAFEFAMNQPRRCGTNAGDEGFIREYDRSVRHIQAKLNQTRLPTFYRGMCDAWKEQIAAAERARMEADAERARIIAQNLQAEAVAAVEQAAKRSARNTAVMFAAAAISFFMTVALFLAFLAIEGHSNAVREAVQMLARQRQEGDSEHA